MNFKPSNFYIGIIDLFAILLPGAIVSLIIYHTDFLGIKSWLVFPKENGSFYISFLFVLAAYLLGHIISQISAYLDKYVYDNLNGTFIYSSSKARRNLIQVKKIRKEIYLDYSEGRYLNNFEWSKNKLLLDSPAILDDIDRYLADSKFFRSLIFIFPILAGVLFNRGQNTFAWICLLLMLFSIVRYFHKKRKATETAFKGIIFLEKQNGKYQEVFGKKKEEKGRREEEEEQSGFRQKNNPNFKKYQSAMAFLQFGNSEEIAHIEIPPDKKWSAKSADKEEVWCCLQGKGKLIFPNDSNRADTILSPNASIIIPIQNNIKIENGSQEALLLLSITKKENN